MGLDMLGFIKVLIFLLAFYLPFSQSASAQIEQYLGPLGDVVKEGQDGAWEARVEGGWFNLLNDSEPGSVQYYYMTLEPLASGVRVVKLTSVLRATGGDTAYSGLILDWISETEYFGFTIGSDGSITVIRRTADGFEFSVADGVRAKLDGSDVLELRESKSSTALYANGEEVFSISTPEGLTPNYGIIAVGTGRFAYTGFSLADQTPATPFPSPGGQAPADGEQPFPAPQSGEASPSGGQPPLPPPGGQAPPPVVPAGGAPASPQDIYYGKILAGTTLGVFFHEFAHALIGETGLPATGPEEDTADAFSALLMAAIVEEGDVANEQERDFLQGMTEFATLFWYYSGLQQEQAGPTPGEWQGEHAPNIKRFRNSFCLIYGSSPERYENVAQKVRLEARTKERCKQEYQTRSAAWDTILLTVARNLGPDLPGKFPTDAPGGKLLLSFQPSQLPEGQAVRQLLDTTGVMNGIVGFLSRIFVFPRDVMVTFRDCDDVNAWYDPQNGSITMCYSIVKATTDLVLRAEGQAGNPTPVAQPGGGGAAPQQQPGPPPLPATGGQQTNDAAAFLLGDWQANVQIQGSNYSSIVRYAPNGRFETASETPLGTVKVSGTWTAQSFGQNVITLNGTPTEWSPQQLCDTNGQCQSNQQPPFKIQVQVTGQNSVVAEGVNWTRTQ